MDEIPFDQWYAAVGAQLPSLFNAVSSGNVTPAVVVGIWSLLQIAPSGLRNAYAEVSEREIIDESGVYSGAGASLPKIHAQTPNRDACKILGGMLRSAENQYLEQETGPFIAPEDWEVTVSEKQFYLIPTPRRSSRASPEDLKQDKRPFPRRGLKNMRVLRCEAGGHKVELKDHRDIGRGVDAPAFSATSFKKVRFKETYPEGYFLVSGVQGPTKKGVQGQLAKAGKAKSFAHVFPELTINPAMRKVIGDELLALEHGAESSPAIVVGGSFHDKIGSVYANRGYVYSQSGKELFEYRKIVAFVDPEKRNEKIEAGKTIPVMVTAIGLIAFPICKDLCHSYDTPYSKLDVDFLLTPSCGDEKTMNEHLTAARRLHDLFNCRPFVAQQCFPERTDKVIGFVLPATGRVRDLKDKDTFVQQPFSIKPVS